MTTNGTLNEKTNEITKNFLPLAIAAFLAVINLSCAGISADKTNNAAVTEAVQPLTSESITADMTSVAYNEEISAELEVLAEFERDKGFAADAATTEARLREEAGDLGGAVIATCKPLAYMFACNGSFNSKANVNTDILTPAKITAACSSFKEKWQKEHPDRAAAVSAACDAYRAYVEGRYKDASALLEQFTANTEHDSFVRYLALSCALETHPTPQLLSEYSAIRARYDTLPEYWLHSARAQTNIKIKLLHAEFCIDRAPHGPFADECRKMTAAIFKLPESASEYLLTTAQIENVALLATKTSNPAFLYGLVDLLSLPDNPRTVYAAGVLKGLCEEKKFFDYLTAERKTASGRIAERLDYILGEVS